MCSLLVDATLNVEHKASKVGRAHTTCGGLNLGKSTM
jgi:hypothetical protein